MKTKLKLIALITSVLILLAFPVSGAHAVVSPDGSYCLDKAGVISEETKAYIAERNKNLEQNCRGAQICVVVLDTINGADPEEYAYDVFTSWRIGRSGEDNGVLMLMLIKDDTYWIMPGTGLEKEVLTGQMLSSTINVYCEPSFAAKDYDTAVRKTFERINEEICSFYRANPEGIAEHSSGVSEGFVGGGSGSAASNYSNNSDYSSLISSCNQYTAAFSRPSCASCNACSACVSCAIACGSCASCGSCGGIGSLILIILLVYIAVQVLGYLGRGSVSRVSHSGGYGGARYRTNYRPHFTSYRPPFGGARPRGTHYSSSGSFSSSGGAAGSKPGSGGGRPSGSSGFKGFSGGGGSTRGGGAGRSYTSARGGSFTRGGFGGFKSGGGGTRGGGAGRTK